MHSWRLFIFVCLFPALAALVGIVFMPESPRFLLEVRSLNQSCRCWIHARHCSAVLKPLAGTHSKYGLASRCKPSQCVPGQNAGVTAHRSSIPLLGKHSGGPPRRQQGSTRPCFSALLNRHEESCLCATVGSWSEVVSHTPTALSDRAQENLKLNLELKLCLCPSAARVDLLFSAECPTRRGVDDPAASSRHQLEGQGGAGESLHSNYHSNEANACDGHSQSPAPAGRGDPSTRVHVHANI